MLILTRKKREIIDIDGGISVEVLHIAPGRVRLGFTAPEKVNIVRREVSGVAKKQQTFFTKVAETKKTFP